MWQFEDELELAEILLHEEEEREKELDDSDDRSAEYAVRTLMREGISRSDARSVIYGW